MAFNPISSQGSVKVLWHATTKTVLNFQISLEPRFSKIVLKHVFVVACQCTLSQDKEISGMLKETIKVVVRTIQTRFVMAWFKMKAVLCFQINYCSDTNN